MNPRKKRWRKKARGALALILFVVIVVEMWNRKARDGAPFCPAPNVFAPTTPSVQASDVGRSDSTMPSK